jgi:hypothetical protein
LRRWLIGFLFLRLYPKLRFIGELNEFCFLAGPNLSSISFIVRFLSYYSSSLICPCFGLFLFLFGYSWWLSWVMGSWCTEDILV